MTTTDIYLVREQDLILIQDALADFVKELNQLEKMHEWYASDARGLLEEALAVLNDILEIESDEQDEEERKYLEWEREAERLFAELCIDREGGADYWDADETDEQ